MGRVRASYLVSEEVAGVLGEVRLGRDAAGDGVPDHLPQVCLGLPDLQTQISAVRMHLPGTSRPGCRKTSEFEMLARVDSQQHKKHHQVLAGSACIGRAFPAQIWFTARVTRSLS